MTTTIITTVMHINRCLVSMGALFFLSCADLTGEETGDSSSIIDTARVGGVTALPRGEGKFLLEGTAATGGYSRHKFLLQFRLPEGESVKFFFYASDQLEGGVSFLWERVDGRVEMEIALNGITHRRPLPMFDDVEEIDLDIDVHNDHTDIHILVWEKSNNTADNEGCTFDEGCLYNTEDFAFDVWLGVGRAGGVFWGMEGNPDSIIKVEGPLVTHSKV